MHFLGTTSHAYVVEEGIGRYRVGNILYRDSVVLTDEFVRSLDYDKPDLLDFLTYDEFEHLKMYFV